MAKLFYTIDEAAAKLQKSESELRAMVDSGQLEEFKMHDVTHFKKAVIDQLVIDDIGNIELSLEDDNSAPVKPVDLDLDISNNSGSAVLDELKFDDEPTPPASTAGGSGAGAEPDLLDLDLADSGIAPAQVPPPTAASAGGSGSGLALDLDDSGPIAPPPTANSGKSAPSGSAGELDLGLDLELGLDDSTEKPAPPAASTPASDSGSGIVLNDMSGSMAAPTSAQPRRRVALDGSSIAGDDLSLEPVRSGLDDSADADASSISAALLDDGVDSFDGGGSLSADTDLFAPSDESGESADEPFADAAGAAPVMAAAPAARSATPIMIAAETVDGAASGLGIGLMVGALASILIAALIVVATRSSGGSALAVEITGDNMMLWLGGLAGGTLLAGGIGFFVGKSIDG
ncbi:MAG: helix-turn-helix domain-containing protein [Planctomycetes bacterium]|nr:helix-turn-helix domain-containing protein [Planctomycetota bacterium]